MKKIGLLIIGFVLVAQAEFKRGDNDLTVIDTATKLEWQDSYKNDNVVSINSSESITYCKNLTLDGKDDWRLPNINELKSIIVETQYAPSIDKKFKYTINDLYWSSTRIGNRGYLWIVNFSNGIVNYGWADSRYVRCVRDYK